MNIPFQTYSLLAVTKRLVLALFMISLTSSAISAETIGQRLEQAEVALKNQQYELAKKLFSDLATQATTTNAARLGLAKLAFFESQLDSAEELMEDLLEQDSNNPEYFYWAARIAGKQSLSASIFTKLGYAKDTKKYFNQAIKIDNQHKPSIIGLIGFHQQAPVIAGGDKEAIPVLLEQLKAIDKRAAFMIQAPRLFNQKETEQVLNLYQEALLSDQNSDVELGEFKFNFAMLLANQRMYLEGLNELLSINLDDYKVLPQYGPMRLYQIGKLAAESRSNLQQGLESMKQYQSIPAESRTISEDWVNFRLAQLNYLQKPSPDQRKSLEKIKRETKDHDLKTKINSILKDH